MGLFEMSCNEFLEVFCLKKDENLNVKLDF